MTESWRGLAIVSADEESEPLEKIEYYAINYTIATNRAAESALMPSAKDRGV